MKRLPYLGIVFLLCVLVGGSAIPAQDHPAVTPAAAIRAGTSYLDSRQDWWLHWPNAARDHDTACVSCHTALPYALARPAIRQNLGDRELAIPERLLLANVVKRVRLWKEVEPFYPDQTSGLPKSSESRGTEAVLNALVLATQDAITGVLSDDTRLAFGNMWALQFKRNELKGAWAWLNFHYEPWESTESPYFGASLAAMAVGTAPGYASSPEIQAQLKLLTDYLQQRVETERLFNRVMVLLASSKLPALLTPEQKHGIIDAAVAKQREDGGWATADLGTWKRVDSTPLDTASDGYATGLITLALQRAGLPKTDARVNKGIGWLARHQGPNGMWAASSLNKDRDPASDPAKFMSDAATAFAVLAIVEASK